MGKQVSVIIPCFNQAHYLAGAIDSVLLQNHPSIEIVVVDDGSTDDTSAIASDYAQVRLISQSNRGLAAARNAGLGRSSGEYVVFLDADDRLLNGAIEAGVDCLQQNPDCAFAWGRYRLRDRYGRITIPAVRQPSEGDLYEALLQGNLVGMHATVMYRRAALDRVGGFDTRLNACEDYELYLRIARQLPIASHDMLVAEYRKHGEGMSADSVRMLEAVLMVMESQRRHVVGAPQYSAAHAEGIRFWTSFYGVRSVRRIAAHVGAGRFAVAGADAARLLRTVGPWQVLIRTPVWLFRHWRSVAAEDRTP